MERGMTRPAEVRLVEDALGAEALARVCDTVWGGTGLVPVPLVIAAIHVGGYGAVAWAGDEPVGASFAIVGRGPVLHSHVTAVLPSVAGRGLGADLKRHQWRWAAAQGFDAITWTFDPLVRRNATFNLATLGCEVDSYHSNFYGRLVDDINTDGSSDRLVVRWAVAGRSEPPAGRRVQARDGDSTIPTPDDVGALRAGELGAVGAWRARHREAFGAAFGARQVVRGMTHGGDYVLGTP
jgi:predicted GNAT superfamily acetyltransferase